MNLSKALGAGAVISLPVDSLASGFFTEPKTVTVGQIMDLFLKQVPGAPYSKTVDTLKAGNRDIKVSGIVTSMFASLEVIQKAVELGANFIIVHEPVYYNHLDETEWLENDEVYHHKSALLKQHNIAVWRNHDYIHSLRPDAVQEAVVKKLDWEQYYKPEEATMMVPSITLEKLIGHVKSKLGISSVRYTGDLSQSVRKVLLLPGASGGRNQINAISQSKPDVVLTGELSEWETAEYVRDARFKGQKLSLVIMGHADSEEPGSEFMAEWLRKNVPGVKVSHVPAKNPLSFH